MDSWIGKAITKKKITKMSVSFDPAGQEIEVGPCGSREHMWLKALADVQMMRTIQVADGSIHVFDKTTESRLGAIKQVAAVCSKSPVPDAHDDEWILVTIVVHKSPKHLHRSLLIAHRGGECLLFDPRGHINEWAQKTQRILSAAMKENITLLECNDLQHSPDDHLCTAWCLVLVHVWVSMSVNETKSTRIHDAVRTLQRLERQRIRKYSRFAHAVLPPYATRQGVATFSCEAPKHIEQARNILICDWGGLLGRFPVSTRLN